MVAFFAASLPELIFGKPSPMTLAGFDSMAQEYLKPKCCKVLSELTYPVPEHDAEGYIPATEHWKLVREFERYLRLRIAGIRAERLELDIKVPDPEGFFSEIDYVLNSAMSCDDPVEREEIIDQVRWDFLDALTMNHMLDFEGICIYRLKLQILEAYRGRTPEEGTPRFEKALELILSAGKREQ
ncbi:MAG: DUF2764 family protein [Lentisphaeria bacterium]|nr:DUF2764 family protein [Lentisphaeria bacterium]